MRGFGAIEALRELLPDVAVPVFVLLTDLGDVALFFLVLTLFYWFGDRSKGAFAFAVVLGGLALTLGLKYYFALPRPPVELHATIADGYGFPSGHATGSTVFWGLLAAISDVGTRRKRFVVASVVVFLVSLSRVVIGVHYAVDVLAGVAVGAVYLAAVLKAADGDAHRAFYAALALSLVALILAVGPRTVAPSEGAACLGGWCTSRDAVALFGGTVGMALAWSQIDVPKGWPSRKTGYVAGLVGLPLLGAAWLASYQLPVPLVVTFMGSVATFAAILLLPTAARALRAKKAGTAS